MDSRHCETVWDEVLLVIKPQINDQSYSTWFEPIKAVSISDDILTVTIPSKFYSEWLEEHYHRLIYSALEEVLGSNARLEFIVNKSNGNGEEETQSLFPQRKQQFIKDKFAQFNSRYTFDTFVEGACNQFARAVSLAVAEKPGKTNFNPLLIWGDVGLGKTHLAQAIGIYSLQKKHAKDVVYVSSKQFTIDFINALQNKKTKEFSAYFDKVDMLIVDDIEYFIGKESTQEQFFHTFNTLHLSGKQIVLTSDRAPREFEGLDIAERLTSRFQNGLVVDIKPPELETRVAIIQKKAQDNGVVLDPEVALLIATHITKNIRVLEGALIRLLAYQSMMNAEINVGLAKTVLKELKFYENKPVSIVDIQKAVAQHFSINENLLRDKTRKQEIVLPRQIAMYLVKELTNHSLKSTGLHFGGRDHTTVLHAVNCVNLLIEQDENIRETINTIRQKLNFMHT